MTRDAPSAEPTSPTDGTNDTPAVKGNRAVNDNRNVDPHGLIAAVLQDRVETVDPSQAHDCLLSWLMDLPEGVDPAAAAAQLLADAPPPQSATARRLRELLSETAAWSQSRLGTRRARRRRPSAS
jgi:hypothetical protein